MSEVESKVKMEVGQQAPDFEAQTQSGEKVNLYQLLESGQQVMLVFYPADMTPGCTMQLCGIRDVYSDYLNLNVKVLGVNHADSKSHQKFIDAYSFPFDIIVDTNKEIINKYGATKSFYGRPTIKRGVVLIGSDKMIKYIFWGQQDNAKIISMLQAENK